MNILQKDLDKINFKDIEYIVEAKIKENNYLEFKGNEFLNEKLKSEDQKTYNKQRGNLIFKIAGLANNRGGLIFLGINEDKKTHEPIKIKSPNIRNFQQLLSRIIMDGLQPAIMVDSVKIVNSKDNKEFVIVLKVKESSVPVMVHLKNYKEGVFPIRVGDDTKIANLHEVSLLFSKKKDNFLKIQAAIDIYETLFKILYYTTQDIATFIKVRMFIRLSVQYHEILPELGIIDESTKQRPLFYILDQFIVTPSLVKKIKSNTKSHLAYIEMLNKLKEFWKTKLQIWLKKSDFSDSKIKNKISFDT